MRIYRGERTPDGCRVTVDGAPLRPRFELSGAVGEFDWGFIGNGQLSLALLSDLLGDPAKAKELCDECDREIVANLPRNHWSMTEEQLAHAVAGLSGMRASPGGERTSANSARPDGGTVGFGDMPVRATGLAPQSRPATDASEGDHAPDGGEPPTQVGFGDMPITGPNG